MSAELKEAIEKAIRPDRPPLTIDERVLLAEAARRVAEADEWLGCERHSRAWAEGVAMPVSCVMCRRITVHVIKEHRFIKEPR